MNKPSLPTLPTLLTSPTLPTLPTFQISLKHRTPYTSVYCEVWVWHTVLTNKLLKTMQIKTNFYWKIEGRKEAVYSL